MIRDPRFPSAVDDVVVEFGNALHQDTADRFLDGEDIPYESLRKIWLDTTQAQPASDIPQAEEALRTLRAVNVALPADRRVRVLLGDPIRWEAVKTRVEHLKWIGLREVFPAGIVKLNVGLALDLEQRRPSVTSWAAPSLVILRGTDIGSAAVCL